MTLDEAWRSLRELLARAPKGDDSPDAALAEFVQDHPGVLETAILERLDELARARSRGDRRSSLAALLNYDIDGAWPGPHQRTLRALDPTSGLRIFAATHRDHAEALDWGERHNSFNLASSWAKRAGWDAVHALELPQEMIDALRWIVDRTPPPDVLPPALGNTSADEIESRIEAYVGVPLPKLLERLYPGGCSQSGFLATGERLGEVIARDARTLAALSVHRHDLAARLSEVLRGGTRPPFRVDVICFQGHVQDPFHTYDMYDAHGGAMSFEIHRDDLPDRPSLRGDDFTITLIRRLGFFQGSVPSRIDPAAAARVLLG